MENQQLVDLTADIVAAHVAHNTVSVGDVANLIQSVHTALTGLNEPQVAPEQKKNGVVSIRASIKPDYLVCLECGQKHKMLKRHLVRAHDMTPDQYRQDYSLPRDYPLVAPNYSEQRRNLAHAIGLGRQRGKGNGNTAKAKAPAAKSASAKAPAARGKAASDSTAAKPRGRGRPRKVAADA
ncbi:Ros/MucR family transcriptional regulator [Sphingosinicella rhizophila]|uniref:MucR family transcriptional regulator n=1 Tax=Sphingosinicella rhizophila TaxID=3050082 RepID=A0ABU3Q1T6_9SPHN|nr:MucR family transcriptional regulator [Sphingosinicella sp. GR2756]MDT9597390.1 MucR family transcriptional regulator [Sphingosinicella sp. GR2756]